MKLSKELLDQMYSDHITKLISAVDPKDFLRNYAKPEDKEIIGLFASALAFGRISAFMKKIQLIANILGESPSKTILDDFTYKIAFDEIGKIKHRFIKGSDLQSVLYSMRCILLLNQIFCGGGFIGDIIKRKVSCMREENYGLNYDITPKEILIMIREELFKHIPDYAETRSLKLMFPNPLNNSPCKRWNLFLRWMVRHDGVVDQGHWEFIRASSLIIPLDIHISNVARKFNLATSKKNNWDTAVEITNSLKLFDAEDPVKYDFLLCHGERLGLFEIFR